MSHNINQHLDDNALEDEVAVRNILKPNPEEVPITFEDDLEDEAVLGRVTSRVLLDGYSCGHKGQQMKMQLEPLEQSLYSRENIDDGHIYEEQVYANPQVWIHQVNRLFNLKIPVNLVPYDCQKAVSKTKDMSSDEYFHKSICYTIDVLLEVSKSDKPAIIRQSTFGKFIETKDGATIYPEVGRSDICIWTGDRFILGDIKRSEEVMSPHALQLYFYASCIRFLLGEGTNLMEEGFIVHCTPGYLYTKTDSARDRAKAVEKCVVTPVTIDLLSSEFEKIYNLVANIKYADPELRVFQPSCVECGYRNRCYPAFLKEGETHLSLVPMDKAIYKELKENGIKTVEHLVTLPPESPLLVDLLEKKECISGLLHRAKKTIEWKGYSNWISKPDWKEQAWVYSQYWVSKGHIEERWMDPEGNIYTSCPTNAVIKTVVVFTERERLQAFYTLNSLFLKEKLRDMDYVVLEKDIKEYIHMPLPSRTLKSLAKFFERLRDGEKPKAILKDWFSADASGLSPYDRLEEKEADVEERIMYVRLIWKSLLALEAELNKPVYIC